MNNPRLWFVAALAALCAGEAAAQALPLAPHRAVYELVLDPSRQGMRIDKASGRIAFEITGNSCQGYAVTLRQVTQLDSGEGRQSTSDLRSLTWEDGAAKSYRFKTQNYLNQDLKDDVDGTADRGSGGGLSVRLAKPRTAPFDLKGPILLPTEHLRKLIQVALSGGKLLEAKVFDGAPDGKRVYDTLSIVGEITTGASDLEEPAKRPELAKLKRFPVTVSYFEQGVGERTPAYVLGFDLYENGVSRALRLDYGTFSLRGELKTIEFLKATPCNQ